MEGQSQYDIRIKTKGKGRVEERERGEEKDSKGVMEERTQNQMTHE